MHFRPEKLINTSPQYTKQCRIAIFGGMFYIFFFFGFLPYFHEKIKILYFCDYNGAPLLKVNVYIFLIQSYNFQVWGARPQEAPPCRRSSRGGGGAQGAAQAAHQLRCGVSVNSDRQLGQIPCAELKVLANSDCQPNQMPCTEL